MIYINENYRLDNDERCFILQKKAVSKKSGDIRWDTICYPSNIESAMTAYARHITMKKLKEEDRNVVEAMEALKEEWEKVINEIKEALNND